MQKAMVVLLILSVGLFGGNMYFGSAERSSLHALHEAFAVTSAQMAEVALNAWGSLGVRQGSEAELERVLKLGTQAAFGVMPARFTSVVEENFVMVLADFSVGEFQVEASAQSMVIDGKIESYLVVTLISDFEGVHLEQARERLQRFFSAVGSKPDITACLVGIIDGGLSPQEAGLIVSRVLGVLRAEMHESYSDHSVTTLTGFSRRLPGGVRIGDRKSNVSLTIRYNPEIDSTLLWLAWPTFTLSV
jgi:hypothetical protein